MSDLNVGEDLYGHKEGDQLFFLLPHDKYVYYFSGELGLLFEKGHVYD